MNKKRLIALGAWGGAAALVCVPLMIAGLSPYLPSRSVAYVVASFAGITCLGLFFIQPMLAANYLPGLSQSQGRKWHQRVGAAIIGCVALHVGGLYVTSPPDTIDALLLTSPTPFSIFGVAAMWGVVMTAVLVLWRKRLGLRYPAWHILHNSLEMIVVLSTVIHAVQIEGTMGVVSKWVLCASVLIATCITMVDIRLIRPFLSARRSRSMNPGPRV